MKENIQVIFIVTFALLCAGFIIYGLEKADAKREKQYTDITPIEYNLNVTYANGDKETIKLTTQHPRHRIYLSDDCIIVEDGYEYSTVACHIRRFELKK